MFSVSSTTYWTTHFFVSKYWTRCKVFDKF